MRRLGVALLATLAVAGHACAGMPADAVPQALAAVALTVPARSPDVRRALAEVYVDPAPVWFDGAPTPSPRPEVDRALHALAQADRDGLDPADYAADDLAAAVRRAREPGAPPSRIALADVALTAGVLRFAADLADGRVKPADVEPNLRVPQLETTRAATLREAVADGRLDAWLAAARPPFALYGRLADALAHYRALADANHRWEPLAASRSRVDPGEPYPAARRLRERLVQLGDLDAAAPVPDDGRYGAALAAGVRRFQRRHGLAPDGVLGKDTIAALDVAPAVRVAQIALAMERLRWLPPLGDGPVIAVNIPSFELWALPDPARHATEALSMPVIVGRAVRSETPVFLGSMERVEFSPYWNVPPGILRNEYLARLARDPSLLAREDLEVVPVRGGGAASATIDDATLHGLAGGSLRLRQRPGPKNALGGVKFVLPNTMDIYLHGTPAQSLFARTRRDFSHGCIRVRDPALLAAFVLRGQPQWTAEAIDAAMRAGTMRTVALARPIPVVVFYTTAIVDGSGTAFFLPDLYGHDAKLAAALARAGAARASR